MPSSPLGSTHGRTMSGLASHHRPLKANTVTGRRAWHDIIALGKHTWSDDVERYLQLSLFDNTQIWTFVIPCYNRPWIEHTIRLRWAWYAIITLELHIQLDDIGCGMHPWPLGSTICRTTLGMEVHHKHWEAYTVRRCCA